MNLFLFIIWNNAYKKKDFIISDLSERFELVKLIEIYWDKNIFSENLSRFYGKKLPANSFKEAACGNGPFTMVIINDKNPVIEKRLTTRGSLETVNANVFDAKMYYRKLTNLPSGNNCIHGSNSIEETNHDLTLLLGFNSIDFINNLKKIPDKLHCNIINVKNLNTIDDFFYVLNNTYNYVILKKYTSNCFEILVQDVFDFLYINGLNDCAKFYNKYSAKVFIESIGLFIDLKGVGDSFCDKKWQENMLIEKKLENSKYFLSELDNKYLNLYIDYKSNKISHLILDNNKSLFHDLKSYMKENNYKFFTINQIV